MPLRELVADAETALLSGPHPERARLDAETLLLHILAQNRAWLLAHGEDPASAETQEAMTSLITRRRAGEPIQYITGESDFFGLPFSVGPGVLIPRPETEHLVEAALERIPPGVPARIADVGTHTELLSRSALYRTVLAHDAK